MKTQTFRVEQTVPRSRERIFSFFEKAENLALITPRWLDFRVLSASPVEVYQGRVIDYQIKLSGVPIHWRSLISRYDPPISFVDEQLVGPYAIWRHLHRFESVPGGTRLVDQVEYRLPTWLPRRSAETIDRIYTKPQLEKIFAYRKAVFADMFGNTLSDDPGHAGRSDENNVMETESCV